MCGIAGIVGQLDESNREALARMSRAMVHRGPDGEGTWESAPDQAGCGVLLAHRRLAILDLSPAGAQPMVDDRTGHVLVFNGEIYNYLALRERLDGAGRPLRSTGDSAVLLRALAAHGADAVGWLRGMFASPAGIRRAGGSCWPAIPSASSPSTSCATATRGPAGRWPSPRSCAPSWPAACCPRRASIAGRWPR